ncbi:hypothetical protein ACEWY4_009808 [Coilia grayii]|uniref:Uroplakin-2 n=1 Tax=Coilia grayii TaxID=363190 RepID=A0ABD1K7J7_9TELE
MCQRHSRFTQSPSATMLTTLVFTGALLTFTCADFNVRILDDKDVVVSGMLPDSLLLSLPPCSLEGQNADLIYSTNTTSDKTLRSVFTVPTCVTSGREEGTLVSRKIAYKVSNLAAGAHYRLQYQVGTQKSNVVTASTRAAKDYNDIDTGLPARSGAMVVITVILSVAMFVLMVAITVTLVIATDED